MRILLATGIFPPDIGGPATYTEKLALELEKRGLKVKIITYSDGDILKSQIPNPKSQINSKFQIPKSKIIRISRKYPRVLRHILYFWRLLYLAKDCDVIYTQNPVSVGFPAVLVSKILKRKLVLKIVGDAAWENYVSKTKNQKSKIKNYDNIDIFQKRTYDFFTELIKKIEKFVAKNADEIITPSQYFKNIIFNWGIPGKKIKVIYNAVEESEIDITKENAKKEIGIEGDIVLSIGRLSPWKGFPALIKIMPDLLEENPNFKLVIAGEGEEYKNFQFSIFNFQLEDKVKLVGKVERRDIPFYYKAADVFVLNSEYEGLSHVILEAMQYRVPVIASNKGGNPELIQDGHNGFLVEYNNKVQIKNAILKLRQDKNLQEKFINNSKEKIKKFSWEVLVEKTLEVLIA